MNKFEQLSKEILSAAGGESNVAVVNFCATRLRLTVNEPAKVNEETIKKIKGVLGLVVRGNEYQVVVGTDVPKVYSEIVKLGKFAKSGKVSEDGTKGIAGRVIDFISGTFVPVLPILVAGGLVNAVLTVLTAYFGLASDSGTYMVLSVINNAAFYFLPIFVGYSAARKLDINPMMGGYLGAILVHKAIDGVAGLSFAGIPVTQVNYNTSVIPVILGVLFMSLVYNFFEKFIPKEVKFFAVPLLTILIVTPVTLILLGPAGTFIGKYIADALQWVNVTLGWLSVAIMGAITPILVMTGMNQALFPLVFAEFAAFGYDPFVLPGMLAANVAVGAAALAVYFKAKNADNKALALSSGITGVLGITEPSIFGVLLRFKKPFIAAMIGGGVGGLFAGIMGLAEYAIVSPGLAAILAFVPSDGSFYNLFIALATIAISFAVAFAATWFLGFEEEMPV